MGLEDQEDSLPTMIMLLAQEDPTLVSLEPSDHLESK